LCYYHKMNTTSPLGPLAFFAAQAAQWLTRTSSQGSTWAGVWPCADRAAVLDGIAEHCVLADDALRRQWQRQDKLAGWRDYDRLIAVLPVETDEFAPDESDGDEGDAVMGIPIWDEGVLAQASLSTVRHAVHLCRYLDDYHEPTIAALRRSYLRRANTDDSAARMVACAAAAEAFLESPVTWRMVVVLNSARVAVRAVEALLGQRISGSGRTLDQLHAKIVAGCRQLRLADHQAVATTILQGCRNERGRLMRRRSCCSMRNMRICI
jgi:hypothetical protein